MPTAIQDLRTATRIGVRTPVVVYCLNESGKHVRCRAWTDDLSATGARITTEQSLSGKKLLARIMLPDLKDQIIIAEVVREIEKPSDHSAALLDIRRSYYGIRFLGVADAQIQTLIDELDSQALVKQAN